MTPSSAAEARTRFERLRQYLESDPQNRGLALEAATSARQAGDLQAEREVLEAAMSRHPQDDEIAYALGINALNLRDYRKAQVYFDSLLQKHAHPAIRYNLAYAQFYEGQPQAAVDTLKGLSDLDWPQLPQARKLMGQALHHVLEDDLAPAIEQFEQYLQAQPQDADARGQLALVCFDDDRNADAELHAKATLDMAPDEPYAHLALGGIALEQQDAAGAREHFEQVLARQPQNGRAWSGLAFARMLDLSLDTAYEAFETAVRYMPDHIGTWHGLAWLQILRGDLVGAQASLDRAMALDRNFGDTHGGLAVVAALQGRVDEAQQLIRRALRLSPGSFPARYAQSLLLSRAGEGKKAQDLVQTLVSSPMSEGGPDVQTLVRSLIERKQASAAAGDTEGKGDRE